MSLRPTHDQHALPRQRLRRRCKAHLSRQAPATQRTPRIHQVDPWALLLSPCLTKSTPRPNKTPFRTRTKILTTIHSHTSFLSLLIFETYTTLSVLAGKYSTFFKGGRSTIREPAASPSPWAFASWRLAGDGWGWAPPGLGLGLRGARLASSFLAPSKRAARRAPFHSVR